MKRVGLCVYTRLVAKPVLRLASTRVLVKQQKRRVSNFYKSNGLIIGGKTRLSKFKQVTQCEKLLLRREFAAVTYPVPILGDSISEGTLVEWNKS